MFIIRKPQTSIGLKQRVPLWVWIALLAAAIFGFLQTRYCHSQLDNYLEVKNISLETEASSYCQVYFEVENKAAFLIKRRIIIHIYKDNLELGSKMIYGEFEPLKTKGFLTTLEFQEKILKEDEYITEISVRFYD